jgi:hypothetical protein
MLSLSFMYIPYTEWETERETEMTQFLSCSWKHNRNTLHTLHTTRTLQRGLPSVITLSSQRTFKPPCGASIFLAKKSVQLAWRGPCISFNRDELSLAVLILVPTGQMQISELHSTHHLLSIGYTMVYLVEVHKEDSLYN